MPTNRFQFSDDFVLNNGNVGINSSSPQEKLDVVGVVKGQDLKVTGVSSFTTYEGFLNSNQNIIENVSISNGSESGSLSGEIIVGTGITVSVSSGTTSSQGYIDSLKVYNTFTVPTGGTVDRPSKSTPGQLFYNKDFKTIEFWDGNVWRQVDNTTQRGRGVFGGGATAGAMDFINISSTGNAISFGVLTVDRGNISGCSSNIRGVFGGGTGPYTNTIDYVTLASQGNAITFGTLSTTNRGYVSACASSTRGVFGGGYTTSPANATVNVIDYIHFSTLGNALDFGDLFTGRYSTASFSSPTRGIWAGGSPAPYSTIDTVTIASTGNAVFFGDLTEARGVITGGCSSSTRGIIGGGRNSSSTVVNTIDYITIASFGNAIDFGDLTVARQRVASCSSSIRGVFASGSTPTNSNTIDYITIASIGNAQDFGDLTSARLGSAGLSDSHGGLGGF